MTCPHCIHRRDAEFAELGLRFFKTSSLRVLRASAVSEFEILLVSLTQAKPRRPQAIKYYAR
jgi:hypothetical protein